MHQGRDLAPRAHGDPSCDKEKYEKSPEDEESEDEEETEYENDEDDVDNESDESEESTEYDEDSHNADHEMQCDDRHVVITEEIMATITESQRKRGKQDAVVDAQSNAATLRNTPWINEILFQETDDSDPG